jgi:hypothetical protein
MKSEVRAGASHTISNAKISKTITEFNDRSGAAVTERERLIKTAANR